MFEQRQKHNARATQLKIVMLIYKTHILEVYNESKYQCAETWECQSIFMSKSLNHLTDGSLQDKNVVVV